MNTSSTSDARSGMRAGMGIDATPVDLLATRWWSFVLRGIAAILFGALTLVTPGVSLFVLVILWGGFAVADGVLAVAAAVSAGRAGRRWGWFLFEGLLSMAAGVVAFAWPGITAMVLLYTIAAWAILTGVAQLGAAIRLRRVIEGEWMLALAGVASVVFGIVVIARPLAGALAVLWIIGSYAIVLGVLLVALGVRLRRFGHVHDRPLPTGAPTPA